MIVIAFPVGAFGSTIEYSLREFSNELTKVSAVVLADGSMHSYRKEFHPLTIEELSKDNKLIEIATPIYPGRDCLTPTDTILQFKKIIKQDHKVVLIYFKEIQSAERNMLFAYYKISNFLMVFEGKEKNWNKKYNSFSDMQLYEQREAISFLVDSQSDYTEVLKVSDKNWLKVEVNDILHNFKNTLLTIFDYCNLSINTNCNIDEFYKDWLKKQQYIIREFETINAILHSITTNRYMQWDKLSIVGEAIIQSRLRKQGLEIACYNLNIFPTNTDNLKILFK